MTDKTFKPGDVVRLKGGGYQMTICGPTKDGRYTCDWHSKRGEGWQGYYVADQLEFIRNDETVAQGKQYEEKIEKQVEEMRKEYFQGVVASQDKALYKFEPPITYSDPDTFNREMPPAPPSSQEDMGPTKTDGTSRNVATVQKEMSDK